MIKVGFVEKKKNEDDIVHKDQFKFKYGAPDKQQNRVLHADFVDYDRNDDQLVNHLEKNKIYRESIHVSDIKFDHDHIILPDRLAFENKSLVLYNYI